jgi:hypothetical protein
VSDIIYRLTRAARGGVNGPPGALYIVPEGVPALADALRSIAITTVSQDDIATLIFDGGAKFLGIPLKVAKRHEILRFWVDEHVSVEEVLKNVSGTPAGNVGEREERSVTKSTP